MNVYRTRDVGLATSLVLFPLLILVYWFLYPAYGLLNAEAMLRAIGGNSSKTAVADIARTVARGEVH